MDWTVVTRNKKQKRRTVQIFVKVNESKTCPLDVSPDDKVSDMMKRIPDGGDMYLTSGGRVLRGSDELRSCGVREGSTVQVVRRLRGGGSNKSKTAGERKKKSPKKVEQNDQSTKEERLPEMDVVFEGVGGLSAEMMEAMLGMDDEQTERMLRMIRSSFAEKVGGDPEMVIGGIRKFVQQ